LFYFYKDIVFEKVLILFVLVSFQKTVAFQCFIAFGNTQKKTKFFFFLFLFCLGFFELCDRADCGSEQWSNSAAEENLGNRAEKRQTAV
jgi:hypothetical protein